MKMDKKEFKKSTIRMFSKYGFNIDGKYIIKEVEDLYLQVVLDKTTYGGDYYYVYLKIYFKELHQNIDVKKSSKLYDFSIRIVENEMPFKINYLELSNDEYEKLLKQIYYKNIEPFIKYGKIYVMKFDRFKFSPLARQHFSL